MVNVKNVMKIQFKFDCVGYKIKYQFKYSEIHFHLISISSFIYLSSFHAFSCFSSEIQ